MNNYMYVGLIQVEAGQVVTVHNAQWLLDDPRFNPVNWVDDGEKVMAQTAISGADLADGDYQLTAKGDILYGGKEDVITIDVEVGHVKVTKADEQLVQFYTDPQPQRPVFPDVTFSKKP